MATTVGGSMTTYSSTQMDMNNSVYMPSQGSPPRSGSGSPQVSGLMNGEVLRTRDILQANGSSGQRIERGNSLFPGKEPNLQRLQHFERRQGKWTQAECEYAMLLIEHFTSGRLPGCSGGESLRTTLSECLMCTPMRITKKLSAKHAIGKCCFKKKGELSAKERVELDDARQAFIASVDKRPSDTTVSNYPTKKRSRTSSEDWFQNEDLSDTKWLDDARLMDNNDHWATTPCHERADADTTRRLKPSVSARKDSNGRTQVRVVAADRTGLIGDISRALEIKNLGIASCVAETLANDVAHDEFDVIHADTKEPVSTDLKELERYLEHVIAHREHLASVVQQPPSSAQSVQNTIQNSASSTIQGSPQHSINQHQLGPPPNTTTTNNNLENHSVHSADNGISDFRRSPSPAHSTQSAPATTGSISNKNIAATTLQVTVPDRPGLLKQIMTSLTSLHLSVVGAKIETVEHDGVDAPSKTALDTFDVVDTETGGPVLDPDRLRAIEERLARDLEQHQKQEDTPMATDQSVPTFSTDAQPIDEDNNSLAWGDVGTSPRASNDVANNDDPWLFPRGGKSFGF